MRRIWRAHASPRRHYNNRITCSHYTCLFTASYLPTAYFRLYRISLITPPASSHRTCTLLYRILTHLPHTSPATPLLRAWSDVGGGRLFAVVPDMDALHGPLTPSLNALRGGCGTGVDIIERDRNRGGRPAVLSGRKAGMGVMAAA